MKKKFYILSRIILPVIIVVGIPITLFFVINFTRISDVIFTYFKLDSIDLPKFILSLFIFVVSGWGCYSFVKKLIEEKEFLPGNIYGNINWYWYKLAVFLGYKKISLKRKPYAIIYKIVMQDCFSVIEDYTKESDNKIDINVIEINLDKNQEFNIIISDTYDINISQLPLEKINNYIIHINRKNKDGTRKFSKDLVSKAGEYINLAKSKKKKINLFLTTNVYNTQAIFTEYFKIGGRDYVNLQIFQQVSKDNRIFVSKGGVYVKPQI